MSLHFLLKAEARTRSLVEVLGMSDDDAFTLFRRVRWGDGDEVICPHCGLVHRHYFRPARQIWRCAGCQEDFSVTSGTIFAFHKHHALAFPGRKKRFRVRCSLARSVRRSISGENSLRVASRWARSTASRPISFL
jgi:transposase-like protein